MNEQRITIQERTKLFAIRCVKAYSQIIAQKNFNDPAVILAKQFLRSSTSIGANCKESISAQSTSEFRVQGSENCATAQRSAPRVSF